MNKGYIILAIFTLLAVILLLGYIAAIGSLSKDFNINLFTNTQGMEMAVNNINYVGQTGFVIKKGETEVFSIRGADGVGWNGSCNELTTFTDTSNDYVSKIKEEQSLRGESFKLNQLNNGWLEVKIKGQNLRLTQTALYFDADDSNGFNTSCSPFIELKNLVYDVIQVSTGKKLYTSGTFVTTVNISDLEDLQKVADIINKELQD